MGSTIPAKGPYNYDWMANYDKNLMKELNWFLYKINIRACIKMDFVKESYEAVNRDGKADMGLGWDVDFFHPSITLDDRMRYIGEVIASFDMSKNNIIGNTLISHFYGGRGVHNIVTGSNDVNNCFVDFDRVADSDQDYIQFLRENLDKGRARKQPIWGTTELHTSIMTSGRNFCRRKYNQPVRLFHPVDVIEWVASFRDSGFFAKQMQCTQMEEIYKLLREQDGIGHYYGFHAAASTSALPFLKYHHDQRFVSPGPGACYTIARLWPNAPKKLFAEAIYFMRENAEEIGLTDGVVFHPKTHNIKLKNGKNLFHEDQDSMKYYGTEVFCCQAGIYLQIRDDKAACTRRRVAISSTFAAMENKPSLLESFMT